jgi:uncharacterized membrane protein HdeD (DUF308 family)|tara:strand:- start:256 stop:429 length:174 start_codon:yes stop_codon:yes gene_type:complete
MAIGIVIILLAITIVMDYSETITLSFMVIGIVMLAVGGFMKSFVNQTRKINEKKGSE